ncbi:MULTISPECIES: tetratricopeptide repeat protein [Streptomyces]|uniref:Tetratricopeptide repeat protein n=1 Tax=Streptomyces venezuelae TaxID=54571 RepID=A0A5P2AWP3_STRVZ|nr:tetratricopeptide repeat protein [Streptomyces venezuelae]QES21331.1 tetratricopeptide repeat protein [Streptomyces venezuelae]
MSGGTSASGDRSVAAGGDVGWVHTGDRVTALPPEALGPVVCPPGLVSVPRKAAHFVGRGQEGELLDREAETVVICGLGGVGKSSLAARWALRQAAHRDPVWWITAESRADVDAGLAALAVAMQPALIDVLPQEALRERALQWLSAHDGWLVVLDNVTDPADVEGLLARTGGRGRIVVTSRTTDAWYGIGRVLTLPVLPAADAVEMFTRVATHSGPRDTTGADVLCAALGQLPLAVEIAAAYCGRTATPPLAYLTELGRSGWPGNAEDAVARTLRVTLDRLAASDPYAGAVLRLLAWFGPDLIPPLLLPPLPGMRQALGELAAHSMVTLHEDGSVSVHRLVQAAVRRADPEDPHREPDLIEGARGAAEAALVEAMPPGGAADPAHWETWRGLMPHIEAYLRYADPAEDSERWVRALVSVGAYVAISGLPEAGVGVTERVLSGAERYYGPGHPYTLGVRAMLLGMVRGSDGAVEQAAAVVRDMTEALGDDDKSTILARRGLALACRRAGRVDEAIALLEGVVADLTRIAGADSRETLGALADLSSIYGVADRLSEAIALCSRAAAGLSALLGGGSVDALEARVYLADLRGRAGATNQALADFRGLLPDCVRVLGEGHPITVHVTAVLTKLSP